MQYSNTNLNKGGSQQKKQGGEKKILVGRGGVLTRKSVLWKAKVRDRGPGKEIVTNGGQKTNFTVWVISAGR